MKMLLKCSPKDASHYSIVQSLLLQYIYLNEEFIKSALQDIVSDELVKIKNSSGDIEIPSSVPEKDDELWEYDGLHSAYQGECEDILLEMQRFYEDHAYQRGEEDHVVCLCYGIT
ncbi:hypothetical protein Ancab_035651 [Ancistrocladus abbreviatus]